MLGGDKRDRTADLLNAIQALSQLSYTPKNRELLTTMKFFKQIVRPAILIESDERVELFGVRNRTSWAPS